MTPGGLGDEVLLHHAGDRAIQGPGAHPEGAIGAGGDVLDDRIPVSISVAHGEQDVERGGGEREECLDGGGIGNHAQI